MKKKYLIPIVIMLSIYFVLQLIFKVYSIDFDALSYIYKGIIVFTLFIPIIILFLLMGCDKKRKKGVRIFAFAVVACIIVCFMAALTAEYMEEMKLLSIPM